VKKDSVLSNYIAKIGRRAGGLKSKVGSIPVLEVQSVLSDYFKMIGRKGGRAKSELKAAAVRENGKRGGRPRKPTAIRKKRSLSTPK
jgi:hypothetical protein